MFMKQILMDNALESWALAIHYCDEILEGKATLGNRKYFVSSLQNAIELFIKQHMLNIGDYRVSEARGIAPDGEPMASYLAAKDLNKYFYDLQKNDAASMRKFFSAEFNKLVDWQKKLFEEYYTNNPTAKNVMGDGLSTLKDLRNNETHFYIDEFDFLKENEFVKLYNLMVVFFEILVHYHLLNIWGEAFGESERIAFQRTNISSFSYKKQLMKSQSVARVKQAIEKEIFPTGSGDDAYLITEDMISVCAELTDADFDELWAYIQMLLKYKMLVIHDDADEDIIDGEKVYNPHREYSINL